MVEGREYSPMAIPLQDRQKEKQEKKANNLTHLWKIEECIQNSATPQNKSQNRWILFSSQKIDPAMVYRSIGL